MNDTPSMIRLSVLLTLAQHEVSIMKKADYLLDQGVLCPPVRLGQTIYSVVGSEVIECTVDEICNKTDSTWIGVKSNNGLYRRVFNTKDLNKQHIWVDVLEANKDAQKHMSINA